MFFPSLFLTSKKSLTLILGLARIPHKLSTAGAEALTLKDSTPLSHFDIVFTMPSEAV